MPNAIYLMIREIERERERRRERKGERWEIERACKVSSEHVTLISV